MRPSTLDVKVEGLIAIVVVFLKSRCFNFWTDQQKVNHYVSVQ